MNGLRIGIAKVDFTPPVGLPLMGNLREDYASTGVHDPLFAKALVLADSAGARAALLAVDICMLTRKQVALMREHIARGCDVPAANVLIAATHIHSGPATASIYTAPAPSAEVIAAFLTRAAEAVVLASRNLQPGKLTVGRGREDRLSFYRRLLCRNGKVHMNWEGLDPAFVVHPLGAIDPDVTAVGIDRSGSRAAAVNFALHPAILDYGNNLYSGEYPGFLAEAMRKIQGPQFETVFFNGCCGNLNHLDHADPATPRRGYAAAQRTGYMLAAAAAEALRAAAPVEAEPLLVSREAVALKRLPVSEETYRWSLDAIERMKRSPIRSIADGLPREFSAPEWVRMYELQNADDHAEVMALRIGEIAVGGLPGEVFCEFGRRIRQESPAKHTLVVELANDWVGYLPTSEAFDQDGGYETTPGATCYTRDAGERLTQSALRQLRTLFG